MVACVPFSSISRQRNARAIALSITLWTRGLAASRRASAPFGANTSFRPPRFRIEIGTRTVMVRPSAGGLSTVITRRPPLSRPGGTQVCDQIH